MTLKFILSIRLSNSLWESDVSLILEFQNIVSILFYNYIEFITLLYISFVQYREYTICLISFSKFPDVSPDFIGTSAIGNLWSSSLELNFLKIEWSETFATLSMHANILGIPFPWIVLYLISDTIEEYSLNNLITAYRDL